MIIDTSALVALFIPEKMSSFVRQKLSELDTCYFLDVVYYEFPNVIRKKVVREELTDEVASEILDKGIAFVKQCIVVKGETLYRDAYRLALKHSVTTYDAALIALAMAVDDVILTTDEKLLRSVRDFPDVRKYFVAYS